MNGIQIGHATHPGLLRECNEDSYVCARDAGLWIVADGMGGHAAGDVASRMAVREITHGIEQGLSLAESIETAHYAIQNAARQGQGSNRMGTTVVALKLDGTRYEIAWVGDSRAYLWDGTLHRLTKDHSYIQMLIDTGILSQEDALNAPNRNVITQALGTGNTTSDQIKVDKVSGQLDKNHALLLCSDGLTGELPDRDIATILAETTVNQSRADRLIEAALQAGGKDNVTVIIVTRK